MGRTSPGTRDRPSDTAYPESITSSPDYGQPAGSFGGTGLDVTFVQQNRDWAYEAFWRRLDGDLRADAGFLPRTDLQLWAGDVQHTLTGCW